MDLQEIVVWVIDKIHFALNWIRTTLGNALPEGKMLGFLDWTTIILLAISLIIAFIIVKSKYVSINALISTGKTRLLIWTAVFFVILRFL